MFEKRKFPRLDKKWELEYRRVAQEEIRKDQLSAFTVNISGGGLCFETNEEIPKGTMLAMELKSTDFPSSIIALAKAIWCKKERKKDKYSVSAEFFWIGWKDSDVQQTMAKYVNKEVP